MATWHVVTWRVVTCQVLGDDRSKAWWPDPPSIGAGKPGGGKAHGGASGAGGGVGNFARKKKWWEVDYRPLVKCDIDAVLRSPEPPSIVRAWVRAIESIHPMRTNTGVPIRDAILLAIRTSREPLVKKYLNSSLRYYKGNAAGTTKFTALWLAIQVPALTPTQTPTLTVACHPSPPCLAILGGRVLIAVAAVAWW